MRILKYMAFFAFFVLFSATAFSFHDHRFSPVPFLATAKARVTTYYQSGQYNADVSYTVEKALTYLNKRIAEQPSKKLAIVLDIDDTVLSSQPLEKKIGYGYYAPLWNKWVKQEAFPAIKPMILIDTFAAKHHIALFFITGRHAYQRKATSQNLKKVGFKYWTHLYLKPTSYHMRSAIPYKTDIRRALTKDGYHIILSMGDQYSDIKGGYAEETFKMPNPMYYVP